MRERACVYVRAHVCVCVCLCVDKQKMGWKLTNKQKKRNDRINNYTNRKISHTVITALCTLHTAAFTPSKTCTEPQKNTQSHPLRQ